MGVEIEVCISYIHIRPRKTKHVHRLMPILTDFKRITIASVE